MAAFFFPRPRIECSPYGEISNTVPPLPAPPPSVVPKRWPVPSMSIVLLGSDPSLQAGRAQNR